MVGAGRKWFWSQVTKNKIADHILQTLNFGDHGQIEENKNVSLFLFLTEETVVV